MKDQPLLEVVQGDAQDWADRLNDEWRSTVVGIIRVGRSLVDCKAELPHGEYQRVFKGYKGNDPVGRPFVLGYRAGRTLAAVAEHPALSNVQYIAHLPPAWGTLAVLKPLPASTIEECIEVGDINAAMSQTDAGKLVARYRFTERKDTFHAAANTKGDRWEILNQDFRDVTIDEPVDAILTDPPYPDDDLHLWEALGVFAHKHLRVGGVLLAWSGQKRLREILNMLNASGLRYGWTMALQLPGQQSRFIDSNMFQTWKPVLVYVKDKWPPHDWGPDFLVSPKREKDRYEWEQNAEPAIEALNRFVSPGGLVVDPMCGVGTFGVAALRSGRRFIGIELDEGRHAESCERLETL